MSASFPTSVKSFTSRVAGDTIQPAHVNDLQDEVTAIETNILSSGLTLTSGKIAFPATQVPSAGANDLDDYEEGSWTPTITGSTSASGQAYSVQVGRYIKIGRLVHVHGRVSLSVLGTITGTVGIGGLPFTPTNITNGDGGGVIGYFDNLTTAVVGLFMRVTPNAPTLFIAKLTGAATTLSELQQADLSASSTFRFSATYLADN